MLRSFWISTLVLCSRKGEFLCKSGRNTKYSHSKIVFVSHVSHLIDLLGLLGHHLEKLVKVDGPVAVDVVLDDQVEDLVFRRVLPDRSKDREKLLRGDRPAAVLE